MKALLIDHDDSFTQNLKHWLKPVFQEIVVLNHTQLHGFQEVENFEKKFDLLILSPGPKSPYDYPDSLEILNRLQSTTPVFGVCLGLQIMASQMGLSVSVYSPPKHGKTSKLKILAPHLKKFENLSVARYHSIKIDSSNSDFSILAESADDAIPMWFQSSKKKWMAVQFHPESFLTENPEAHLNYLKEWLQS